MGMKDFSCSAPLIVKFVMTLPRVIQPDGLGNLESHPHGEKTIARMNVQTVV